MPSCARRQNAPGRQVPVEILETIARLVQSNIRELEGALTRVDGLFGSERSAAFHAAGSDCPGRSAPAARLAGTAPGAAWQSPACLACTPEELLGRSRSRDVALPRQVAMYLMREEVNASLPQIGEALGGRDHTTVMYACEKVADMIERDDRLRRQVLQIREQLYGRALV